VFKITICICFISTLLAQNSQHQEIIERLIAGQDKLLKTKGINQQEYQEAIEYLKQFSKTTEDLLGLLKFPPNHEGVTSELLEDDIVGRIKRAVDKHNQEVLEDLELQNPLEIIYRIYHVFKKDSEKSPFR